MYIRNYKNWSAEFRATTLQAGLSFVDQVLISGFNFLIGVILIRKVEAAQYGYFVFAVSIVLLVVGFQNALVTTQFTVIGPQKDKKDQNRFAAALFIGQYRYWLPLSFGTLFTAFFAADSFANDRQLTTIAMVVAISCLGTLCREFFKSYFFFKLQPQNVLRIDICYIAIVALGWYFLFSEQSDQHVFVLGALGLASLLCIFAKPALWPDIRALKSGEITSALKECWPNGKWALLGVMVTWLQTQCYVYLTATMHGPEHTAIAHAGRLLLMPIALLTASYGRLFRAKWSHTLHASKPMAVFSSAYWVLAFLIAIIIVYAALLYTTKSAVISLLFGEDYHETGAYILLWTLLFIFQAIRSNASLLLQVFEKFRAITIFNAISAVITIALAILLNELLGPSGSVWAMIAGEIILAISLSVQVHQCRTSISPSA